MTINNKLYEFLKGIVNNHKGNILNNLYSACLEVQEDYVSKDYACGLSLEVDGLRFEIEYSQEKRDDSLIHEWTVWSGEHIGSQFTFAYTEYVVDSNNAIKEVAPDN